MFLDKIPKIRKLLVKHGPELPVPKPHQSIYDVLQTNSEFSKSQPTTDQFECSSENLKPLLFTQTELNALVRDFGLT